MVTLTGRGDNPKYTEFFLAQIGGIILNGQEKTLFFPFDVEVSQLAVVQKPLVDADVLACFVQGGFLERLSMQLEQCNPLRL